MSAYLGKSKNKLFIAVRATPPYPHTQPRGGHFWRTQTFKAPGTEQVVDGTRAGFLQVSHDPIDGFERASRRVRERSQIKTRAPKFVIVHWPRTPSLR